MRHSLHISKHTLLSPKTLLLITTVLATALATWLLRAVPVDVRITVEPYSLCWYDDHAGHSPMGALVRITNVSNSTVWFLGLPGVPTYVNQQCVDGKWNSSVSSVALNSREPFPANRWAALRSMESITILAGPISERATEVRIGVPLTTERFTPTKAHWIFGPVTTIVKRGQNYFPEAKAGARQEDRVLPIPCHFDDVEGPPP